MDRFAFSISPCWQDVEAVFVKTHGDLMRKAATASREAHEQEKGRMEGAAQLWGHLIALRDEWRKEDTRG